MCGSKGSTTTSSTFSPPPGVQANYDYLANQAKNVASTPFQQYGGQMVAPMTPEQQAGIGQINASANLAQPYIQAGTSYEQQGANPFGQEALNQYMSPYIGSVANATMANLNETNAQQQQQVLGSDIARGAYGGDRSQVAQSELARQQGLATGQTMSGVYQSGFNQAEQQFNSDQARRMAAGQTLAGFGTAAQNAAMQGGQAMMGAGAQEQAYQQALDSANQQQFQAAQAYPFETTQFLGNLLLGIGGQSGGTSLTSQPGPNVGSQLLGGLMTLGSIPWPSDERLKENMEPVGKTFDGQNIYKFNYKNDGRTMLGLSAQEVEKHTPEAVHKDGQGMRSVDYGTAVNKAAKRGHFADGGVPDWMGGAVHEGLGRAHFATAGSVSDIPYTSQPSGGTGTTPLSLKDLMPLVSLISEGKLGDKTNIPNKPAPLEEGTMMDVAKQLQGMSSDQRANMKANIGSVDSILNPTSTTPGTAINAAPWPSQWLLEGESQGTHSLGLNYAAGGVAGRGAYKDGQTVQPSSDDPPDQTEPNSAPSNAASFSLGNILPSKGQSAIEKATGLDLSDNARMGMLAAGLGMLSSRSPFFGVGVGEGATAGLGAYYNAKANDRAYANKQQELQMTEEQRDIDRQRLAEEKRYHDIDSGLRGQEYGWKAYEYLQSGMKYGTLSTGEKGYVDSRNGVEIPENKFGEYIKGQMAKMPFGANILGGKTAIGPTTSTGVSPAPSANAKLESTTKAGVVPATASTDQPPAPDETKSIVDAAKAVLNPPVDTSKAAVVPVETVLNPPNPAQNATLPFKVGAYGVPELSAEDHYNPDILTKAASYLREKYADLRDPQHEAQTKQALEWEKEARDLQNRKIATSSGTEYIATPGVVRPLSVGPKPIGPDDPKSYVNPDTGAVVQVPVDVGYKTTKGWKPDPEVPSNAVLQSGDKFQDTQKTKSAELESELMKGAPTLNNAITAIINYSAAAKSSEFGPTTTDKAKVAGVLKGLHFDSLADGVLDGTKTLADVADALKSTVDQAQTSAQAAFPRVTQNEFAIQKEEGTPNIDIDPNAAQRLSAVRLAPLLYTNSIISAWQKEKQTNNTENFESYLATWKKAHPYSLFQDSARKLLGNFRGTDLPQNADIIDNGLYVMPNAPSKTNSNLYKAAAAEHIRAGQTFKVSGVKHQGKEGWSYDAITPSDANSTFDAMTHYPAFQYGVQ